MNRNTYIIVCYVYSNAAINEIKETRTEAFTRRCFIKNDVLKNDPILTKSTYLSLFFNKVACLRRELYQKSDSSKCFPVNFAKVSWKPFYRTSPVAASDQKKQKKLREHQSWFKSYFNLAVEHNQKCLFVE